jgi:hypothetical protein
MTRRERHIRIIESWSSYPGEFSGGHIVRFHLHQLLDRRKFDALKDEAIEELARDLISSSKLQKKYNEEARKLRAAR